MPAPIPKSRFDSNGEPLSSEQRAALLAYSHSGNREIAERRECFAGVTRFIGLDIHKQYVVVIGVDRELNQVLGPVRLTWERWPAWVDKMLNLEDAVAVEMTTNTWEVHDFLVDRVHSVTVAHPPHLKLITSMPVMNDKRSSQALASLLACGLLRPVWVPDQQTREWVRWSRPGGIGSSRRPRPRTACTRSCIATTWRPPTPARPSRPRSTSGG